MQNNGNIFEGLDLEMTAVEDPNAMSQEEEADYWAGVGSLTIFVTLVIPEENIFEFDVVDYSGCVGGIQEAIGIDYLLTDIWCINKGREHPLKEGIFYTFHNISAFWTSGDGYSTDDDVDYYFGGLTHELKLWPWFKTKVAATWWKHIGWRFSK